VNVDYLGGKVLVREGCLIFYSTINCTIFDGAFLVEEVLFV